MEHLSSPLGYGKRYLLMNQSERCPQPMKFWEVCSAFREFEHVIAETFSLPEWRVPFLDWYLNRDNVIQSQNRAILDAVVPPDLSAAIARRIPLLFELDSNSLRRMSRSTIDQRHQILTTLEVHDRFGGAYIEAVLEFGSATVAGGK